MEMDITRQLPLPAAGSGGGLQVWFLLLPGVPLDAVARRLGGRSAGHSPADHSGTPRNSRDAVAHSSSRSSRRMVAA